VRLFLALPLPDEASRELAAAVAGRRARWPGKLAWHRPEDWHITLQFLGEAGGDESACVTRALRALQLDPVTIEMEGLGAFAGVLYAAVALTPGLARLQEAVTSASGGCGFRPEERAYRPHITLARGRSLPPVPASARVPVHLPVRPFMVREVRLYQSVRGPAGARYRVRERFPLGC
jgi:2'-5' RNA ligase